MDFFKARRTGINHNFKMDVVPGYIKISEFRGGFQWYKMERNDFISPISFNLRNKNGNFTCINRQSISFRLPIKDFAEKVAIPKLTLTILSPWGSKNYNVFRSQTFMVFY